MWTAQNESRPQSSLNQNESRPQSSLNLAFNQFTFLKNFKGEKLRPLRVFDSWLSCLAFLLGIYLLNAGL